MRNAKNYLFGFLLIVSIASVVACTDSNATGNNQTQTVKGGISLSQSQKEMIYDVFDICEEARSLHLEMHAELRRISDESAYHEYAIRTYNKIIDKYDKAMIILYGLPMKATRGSRDTVRKHALKIIGEKKTFVKNQKTAKRYRKILTNVDLALDYFEAAVTHKENREYTLAQESIVKAAQSFLEAEKYLEYSKDEMLRYLSRENILHVGRLYGFESPTIDGEFEAKRILEDCRWACLVVYEYLEELKNEN